MVFERELEKQIADLEREKCELLGIIQGKDKAIQELEQKLEQTEKDLADYQFNYPTIKELEKENAELKTRLNAINLLTPELQKASSLRKQQLTKAKEIIKKLVLEVKGYEEINGYDTCEPVQEAEQFLSEVEK